MERRVSRCWQTHATGPPLPLMVGTVNIHCPNSVSSLSPRRMVIDMETLIVESNCVQSFQMQ